MSLAAQNVFLKEGEDGNNELERVDARWLGECQVNSDEEGFFNAHMASPPPWS